MPRIIAIGLVASTLCVSVFALARSLFHVVPADRAATAPPGMYIITAAFATVLGVLALMMERRRTVPRERSLAPVRMLFYVAVAAWISFLLWAQPYSRVRMEIAVTIITGSFAFLITIEPLIARIPRRVRRAGDILLFNVCLTLLGLDLGLRALAVVKPSRILAHAGGTPMERLEENRQPPGTVRYQFPCNGDGEYDEEFRPRADGQQLVIAIGDSFSYGVVPHAYHFTTVCERLLGVPVYNMGVPAIGPPEYDYLLEHEALVLKPDVVVINLFIGNDLVFLYEVTPTLDPFFRSWFDRRSSLLWLVPDRMIRITMENRSRTSDQGPLGSAQGESTNSPMAPGSTIEQIFPWVVDSKKERPPLSDRAFYRIEDSRALSICRAVSPPMDVVFDYMLRMKRMAGSIPLVVMMIPDEFQVEDEVWERVLTDTAPQELDRDRAQKILRPWFEANGIPCLDLLPLLRDLPPLPDGRQHAYHLRDTHFNARGNRVAGEALAEFLRSHWPQLSQR